MQKQQWILVLGGLVAVVLIFWLGDRTPPKDETLVSEQQHGHSLNIDSILVRSRSALTPDQVTRLALLEESVIRGDVKSQRVDVLHQIAHFWRDSARVFEPYAWYQSEAARLENSQKSLTFAAHLFLNDLRFERDEQMRRWKADQAKDLFERSLTINPQNDSSRVGLAATEILGGLSEAPMNSIRTIREIADKDTGFIFAQMVLGHASMMSGQYDLAINRFQRVARAQPGNLEAIMMLAEIYERKADKKEAIFWYQKAKGLVDHPVQEMELDNRIRELSN